jgi:predicted ester cyclase
MSPNLINLYFRLCVFVVFCFFSLQSSGQDSVILNNNKKVIVRYFDEVINSHNLSSKGEFFHADYIWHTMDGKDVHSAKDSGHTAILRWLFNAIPDIRYEIDNIEAGGEMVGVSATATGIAKSEMFGLPPAQKKVYFKQMFFYRLKEGKIIDQWEVVDADGIKAQLERK